MDKELEKILEDFKKLQDRIDDYMRKQGFDPYIEPLKPYNPPTIPNPVPWDPSTPINPDPNPIMGKCPKCHLELHQVMGYVCTDPQCPTFPQVTCNSTYEGRPLC